MKGTDGSSRPTLALKVCVAGDFKVGKSSLVRRFVSGTFSDDYIATLGAKVSSKRFAVPDPFHPGSVREVNATVWDLMGQRGFRDMIQDAFFLHAGGVLYVADATRPETLYGLEDWRAAVVKVAGAIPGLVLVNINPAYRRAEVTRRPGTTRSLGNTMTSSPGCRPSNTSARSPAR